MTNPESVGATFPNKTLLNETERRLSELQSEADELGLALWEEAQTMQLGEGQSRMRQLQEEARRLIEAQLGLNKPTTLSSRYIYESTEDKGSGVRIEYPLDSLHYFAYIEGVITDVKPMPLQHPTPDRRGIVGYRLCATINANRVMGWRGSGDNNLPIAVPVGEIYTEMPSHAIGESDALIPMTVR